ncbi:MAG: site-specific integrase [Motilibacteraceae bacterium]
MALAWYLETRSAVRAKTYVAPARETVRQAVDDWLAGRRSVRPSTLEGYRDVLKPVQRHLGALSLQSLSRRQLDELVNRLQAGDLPRDPADPEGPKHRPWSARSVRMMLAVLEQVLDDAIKAGTLARNPAHLVDRPSGGGREMQTWTPAQVSAFLAKRASDPDRIAWLLALYGLRRGEIAGLRWDEVDLTAGTLAIREARVAVAGAAVSGAPKSERGIRTLPLSDSLALELRAHRKRQAEHRLRLGVAWTESGYVITDEAGSPLPPTVLTTRWKTAVREAGLPAIRLHDARHTSATLMHLQGVPTAVVSAWLGHSSAAFTMRTYVHSQHDALAAGRDTLEAVMGGQ